MKQITFEQLPEAVGSILQRLDGIEQLLSNTQQPAQSENTDEILNVEEAAKFLNLAKSTIYRLRYNQQIPCSKPGKHLYFSKKELTEWVQSGRVKTISEIEKEASNYVNRNKR